MAKINCSKMEGMKIRVLIILASVILVSCGPSNDREVHFYPDGGIKSEVPKKNGKRHGASYAYFSNGNLQSKAEWQDGMRHGKAVIYFDNGKVRQENDYKHDVLQKSIDYNLKGYKQEERLYDDKGRVVDYFNFREDGSRDFSGDLKDPIFIRERDTVEVGEEYVADIRLGNRQFDSVLVYIGDITDPYITKKTTPLRQKDDLTSIFKIETSTAGLNSISGVIIEWSTKSDSFDVIPFTHRFYVRERKDFERKE